MAKHPIVHIEFAAKEPKAASEFYKKVFDWKIEHMPEMDYYTFSVEPGPGGGFNPVDGEMIHKGDVLVYIQTDDIEATLKSIEGLGGKIVQPKTEIPNMGWYALFEDPFGNRVGIYQGMLAEG